MKTKKLTTLSLSVLILFSGVAAYAMLSQFLEPIVVHNIII